jgi:hypothetical protein
MISMNQKLQIEIDVPKKTKQLIFRLYMILLLNIVKPVFIFFSNLNRWQGWQMYECITHFTLLGRRAHEYMVVACTTTYAIPLLQYFSYIVVVNFIGGRNRRTRRKTSTCCKLLTKLYPFVVCTWWRHSAVISIGLIYFLFFYYLILVRWLGLKVNMILLSLIKLFIYINYVVQNISCNLSEVC